MRHRTIFLLMLFAGILFALTAVWGQEKNLGVNKAVTAKIRAFDQGFFKGFDVYSAGTQENPTALVFDIEDDYSLVGKLWEKPLKEEEIIYAIHRLDDQYINRKYNIPFEPRALNIVNSKGAGVGYVSTGMTMSNIHLKRDGRVTVFLPTPQSYEGGVQGPPS